MNESQACRPLMDRLKESTRAMHDSAEGSKFQALLTAGNLPIETYAQYLSQLYLIHKELEQSLLRNSRFNEILDSRQLQENFLLKDLENLNKTVENLKALDSTEKLLKQIKSLANDCPAALLGMHYVLLGSKHGGKFIARNCREKYGLENGCGVLYFDPYGQDFMPLWKSFRESMNNLDLSQEEIEKTCKAAADMFEAVGEIGTEIQSLSVV